MVNKQKTFNLYCKAMRLFNIAPLPPLIIWEPTLACNFRCSFCGFYGPGGAKPNLKKEMPADEQYIMWHNILNSYKWYKPHVGITGGEPLLKDIRPTLELFKRRKISWSLTTNGYLLGNYIKLLKQYNCSEIRVSLHGPEEIHNKTVGIEGAFQKVTMNIIQATNISIPVLINCVITNENVNHLEEMKTIAGLCGAKIRFQHLEFLTEGMKRAHKKFTEQHFGKDIPVNYGTTTLSKKNIPIVEQVVVFYKNVLYEPNIQISWDGDVYPNHPFNVSSEIKDYYTTFKPLSSYCYQPWGTARIDPYGNVYPCIHYHFGNLKDKRFKAVWNGDKAKHFRKLLKKNKLFPGCMRCCKLC